MNNVITVSGITKAIMIVPKVRVMVAWVPARTDADRLSKHEPDHYARRHGITEGRRDVAAEACSCVGKRKQRHDHEQHQGYMTCTTQEILSKVAAGEIQPSEAATLIQALNGNGKSKWPADLQSLARKGP